MLPLFVSLHVSPLSIPYIALLPSSTMALPEFGWIPTTEGVNGNSRDDLRNSPRGGLDDMLNMLSCRVRYIYFEATNFELLIADIWHKHC